MKTLVYVCRHAIERNDAEGTTFPPITVRHADGSAEYANSVHVDGPCDVIHGGPLLDGTRVWVETESPVHITS